MPIDVSLLLGGLLVGIALGVAVGRHCATHPGSSLTRVLHVLTAFQLSTPVFFLALLVIYLLLLERQRVRAAAVPLRLR